MAEKIAEIEEDEDLDVTTSDEDLDVEEVLDEKKETEDDEEPLIEEDI